MELEIKFTKAYLLSRQRALRDAGHIELPFHSWCEGCENEEQEAAKIVLLLSHFSIVYISCKSGHHGCAPFNKPNYFLHYVNLFGKAQECMKTIITFTFNLVCSMALRPLAHEAVAQACTFSLATQMKNKPKSSCDVFGVDAIM